MEHAEDRVCKAVLSERLQNWIKPNDSTHEMNLRKKNTFLVPKYKTERYRNSAMNAIIRAINDGDNFVFTYED